MRVGIVTINDNNNYGNRLQNYAVQEVLKKLNCEPITLKNEPPCNFKRKYIYRLFKRIAKKILKKVKKTERLDHFLEFNKNINFSDKRITTFTNLNYLDFCITGSDQVWNYNFARLSDVDLLENISPSKRIAYSASFGVSELPIKYHNKVKNALKDYKAISTREDAGKKIIKDILPNKKVEVLIDPTMMLDSKSWDKVAKKPKQLKNKKYILNYFLGNLSDERKNEINRIAKENKCDVINLLDKNSPFYHTGPSEFLYLEKNAFLICTDSFHSCVFSILYNRPFIVFEREDNIKSMNSRIDTLLNKLKLQNRVYKGKINDELLNHDYSKSYEILEKEREKTINFLTNSLK